jgi:hypothetical protein
VALVLFLPNLIWQMQHDWATLGFVSHLNAEVMSRIPPVAFLLGQVVYLHPVTAPVWLAGVGWLLGRPGGSLRPLAWGWLFVMVVLLAIGSKIYYSAPFYPTLLAAGGVAWASWTAGRARRWARPLMLVGAAGAGVALAPVSLPLLPIEEVDAYAQRVTFGLAGAASEVTGDLHDMFGWEEQAAAVYAAAAALPEADRQRLALLAGNYGEAGALEAFAPAGQAYPVVSPHLSYWLWSSEAEGRDVFLTLGISQRLLVPHFEEVHQVGTAAGSPYAQPYERDLPIWLCRRPRRSLEVLWQEVGMQL